MRQHIFFHSQQNELSNHPDKGLFIMTILLGVIFGFQLLSPLHADGLPYNANSSLILMGVDTSTAGSSSGSIQLISNMENFDNLALSLSVFGSSNQLGSVVSVSGDAIAEAAATFLLTVNKSGTGTGLVRSLDSAIICQPNCSASYASGTAVTLVAFPDSNMTFTGWSGVTCSGSGESQTSQTCTFVMDAAKTATASFEALYTLRVMKTGIGSGRVFSSPPGIDCGTICTSLFLNNTFVTLTPIPDTGWFFNGWSGPCNGKSATCQLTLDQSKIVTANFGPLRQDALSFDFYSNGLFDWNSISGWLQIHPLTSNQIVAADLDGNSISDLVINFGYPYGLWAYMNKLTWLELNTNPSIGNISPINVVAADLDANTTTDLVVDYGSPHGLWKYLNNSTWGKVNDSSSRTITPAYLDENNLQDLGIDFTPNGLWNLLNSVSWVALQPPPSTPYATIATAAGDLDGNGHGDLVYSFAYPGGLWAYMNNQTWLKLHPASPTSLVACDLDGNGITDLAINFGADGLWAYLNKLSWVQVHPLPPSVMAAAYLENSTKQQLVLDFAPYGIWTYKYDPLTPVWTPFLGGPASRHIVAKPL